MFYTGKFPSELWTKSGMLMSCISPDRAIAVKPGSMSFRPTHAKPSPLMLNATWGICTRRAGKVYKARSRLAGWLVNRLYRSQILQVNVCLKALVEIYTMHSLAPFSNLNFFVKNCWNVCWFFTKCCKICQNVAEFLLNFDQNISGFSQNATIFKSCWRLKLNGCKLVKI